MEHVSKWSILKVEHVSKWSMLESGARFDFKRSRKYFDLNDNDRNIIKNFPKHYQICFYFFDKLICIEYRNQV